MMILTGRQDGLALFWYGKLLIEQQRHQEVPVGMSLDLADLAL